MKAIPQHRWIGTGLGLVLALGLLASGCMEPAGSTSGLDGREFLLESAEGFEPVAGTTLRLRFADGELGFEAGCNHHGGPYALRDGLLVVTGLGSTEIGCDATLHAQDAWLADFITSSPALQLDGARLTLTGTEATLQLLDREVADPDRSLVGAPWTIDTFIEGGAASNVSLQADPSLEFAEDGTLRIDTTCSIETGHYVVNGDSLTLSGVTHSELTCAGAAAMAAAHIRLVMADGVVHFQIDANRLTLMRADLGLGASTP